MSERGWRGALIGCGFFAPNQLHAWASIPGVDVVALCDLDLSRARSLGSEFGISSAYDCPQALLDRNEIDFVDIVTTAGSHRGLVELSASRGKRIICQKPFAETLADADAMVAACRVADMPLMIHENFRWQRPFLEIAKRIRGGEIGRPRSLRLNFKHNYDVYRQQPYLAMTEHLALMDVGLHLFDLARVLMGEVHSIHCRTQRLNPRVRGEDSFVASLGHDSGAVSVVDCSFFSRAHPDLFPQTLALVEGDEGSLELRAGYRLIAYRNGAIAEVNVEPAVPAWGNRPWHCIQDSVMSFQRHVVEVLEGRASPEPSGAHNRETLALVLAAYESAARDRNIEMSRSKSSGE